MGRFVTARRVGPTRRGRGGAKALARPGEQPAPVHGFEIREVLPRWLRGEGFRSIERLSSADRKTIPRHLEAALDCGMVAGGGEAPLAGF